MNENREKGEGGKGMDEKINGRKEGIEFRRI